MNTDNMIERYIELRDKKTAINARVAEATKPLTAEMTDIENQLLKSMNDAGLQNMKGASGTAYISRRDSVKAEDWDAFIEFVKEADAWHMLERRPSKTAAVEFSEENDGHLPPGLGLSTMLGVNIRKS